jgi:hypothetical protein
VIASFLWAFRAEKVIDEKTGEPYPYDCNAYVGTVSVFPRS